MQQIIRSTNEYCLFYLPSNRNCPLTSFCDIMKLKLCEIIRLIINLHSMLVWVHTLEFFSGTSSIFSRSGSALHFTPLLKKNWLESILQNSTFLARLYKSTGRALALTSMSALALALLSQKSQKKKKKKKKKKWLKFVKAIPLESLDGSS